MAIIGLLSGLIYAFLGTLMGSLTGSAGFAATLGFLGIIVLPIIYGILGFVVGAIGAFLYNLVAGWVGGVELELRG